MMALADAACNEKVEAALQSQKAVSAALAGVDAALAVPYRVLAEMAAVCDVMVAVLARCAELLRERIEKSVKVVEEKTLTTDDYGCCHADFVLPEGQLTGRYSLQAGGSYQYFRVEQYKRPTFQLEFPEVNERYAAGDTLEVKAKAMSFAGV